MVQDRITNVNTPSPAPTAPVWRNVTQPFQPTTFLLALPTGSTAHVRHYSSPTPTGESGWHATAFIHINSQTDVIVRGGETFASLDHAQRWAEQWLHGRFDVQFFADTPSSTHADEVPHEAR